MELMYLSREEMNDYAKIALESLSNEELAEFIRVLVPGVTIIYDHTTRIYSIDVVVH